MSAIVECVPNFSEGRNQETIDAIADAIRQTNDCHLLDVDPGPSTNRTVYTFVGNGESVVEGALNAARVAKERIDMTKHKGAHPRMGALDVCPFIPISGMTPEECVDACAVEFASRLAAELIVPVYLYDRAAKCDARRELANIREGEYEGLAEKIVKAEWKPDYGPAEFVGRWGASVVGVRKFLIAYNVNLLGTKEQAHRIALGIRSSGRGGANKLKCCKALGWYLDEVDLAQVSINLTDFEVTPPHIAFEECSRRAKELNLAVVGSEIVGLVPLAALLMAADYYIEKENLFVIGEKRKIRLAVERLGLDSISKFIAEKKIIEYMIGSNEDGPLVSMSVRQFIESLSSRTSTPGGGSASAAFAAMGAALGTMVGWMSFGNKKFAPLDAIMRKEIEALHSNVQKLLPLIDADTNAFDDYMTARKLPNETSDEKAKRDDAMQAGLLTAIRIPMSVMHAVNDCWPALQTIAEKGNFKCISDVQVGAKGLEAGVFGAYHNVMINCSELSDDSLRAKVEQDAKDALNVGLTRCREILDLAEKRVADVI